MIGRYWVAHHVFFSQLQRMDRGLIWLNIVYLSFIAFLPFPTALLGNFFENPLAFTIYAVAVAVVSGMELVMFRHAYRHGLLRRQIPEDVYRWGATLSLSPVIFFMLSIPRRVHRQHLRGPGLVPGDPVPGDRRPLEARGRRRASLLALRLLLPFLLAVAVPLGAAIRERDQLGHQPRVAGGAGEGEVQVVGLEPVARGRC